jgi:glutamate carboxypeptidase
LTTSSIAPFDAKSIPFDVAATLQELRAWVECESPTWDATAVNRMGMLVSGYLERIGAKVTQIEGREGFGNCLRARFPHPRSDQPGILILGHLDTVHPLGTLGCFPWREEAGRCFGPGILDMKSGVLLALEAIAGLQALGRQTSLPITILLNSDEEVGSPSSRALVEKEAARQRYVLVPEPARRDGGVVVGRYAVSRFAVQTKGRPSHAGLFPGEGRSAIHEMAAQILAIESMSEDGSTFSVGVVNGGSWVNCVAEKCVAEVLVVSRTEPDRLRAAFRLGELEPRSNEAEVVVIPGLIRPVWEPNDGGRFLYERARMVARGLGLELPSQTCGGGSDANFTGALGIATLDGVGARGNGAHTLQEHIIVDSLKERAQLMAGLLVSLD